MPRAITRWPWIYAPVVIGWVHLIKQLLDWVVIKLGAQNQQGIAGVLAFPPASGAPMADCRPELFLKQMSIPLAVFRPDREMAIESVITQTAAFRALGVAYHETESGRHGSLMLRESQTGINMDHVWQPVLEFISGIANATT